MIRWNTIKLRYKLFFSFGIVLLLNVISCLMTYNGVSKMIHDAQTVIMGNQLDSLLAQKEIDHLLWMDKVNSLWTDSRMSEINVQTNDHQCGFGQWLYGDGRKQLEKAYPDIAALVRKIEQPHRQLHESVIEINHQMAAHSDRPAGLAAADAVLKKETKPALAEVKALLGDIRKAAKDKIMTDQVLLEKAQSIRWNVIIVMGIAVGVGLLLALFIASAVSRPIVRAAEFVEQMSGGDFTQELHIPLQDEIGQLAASLNHLVVNLGKMIREVNNGVATLDSSSSELSAISEQMNQGTENTSSKANTVATAAEEMSVNMNNVAAASEQAANNVNMVATATEEMSYTVKEIARNSEKARTITSDAVDQAQNASAKVDELGIAANDINQVTEVITEISEQTNLLALNATIEAARAGEAGKGFAVVANEIKELAKQTAQATQQIKQKISGIQVSTNDTVDKIKQVSTIIGEVNEIVASIATAVEEQSVTTEEITTNVSQASQGIQEVNANVAQSSAVSSEISKEISGVDFSAKEMATSSSQVHVSAQDLAKVAGRLTKIIAQFKIPSARFDIGAVKGAHLKWRARLEGLLHGRDALKPEEVASHHECAFGKWYDSSDGQTLKQIPSFEVVGHHHEKVHTYARQIVDLFHQGETQKATAMLTSFENEREKLFTALDELYLS